MKKAFVLLSALLMLSFISCGPSQKEEEKQKKIDDSIFEKDRNTALDNANKLLSDTVATGKDTTAQAGKVVKK
jgi:hypothetical protein